MNALDFGAIEDFTNFIQIGSMRGAEQEFIEKMGMASEEDGFPRIAGRLFGLLILHEGPFSLDELAETLQVSKASVSTNARLLEQAGIAERTGQPGDRRDFYRLSPDAPERIFENVRRRMEQMRDLMEETAHQLPDEVEDGRERVDRMKRFYSFMLSQIEQTMGRWEMQSRSEDHAGAGR